MDKPKGATAAELAEAEADIQVVKAEQYLVEMQVALPGSAVGITRHYLQPLELIRHIINQGSQQAAVEVAVMGKMDE